ncbi:hypothetical protein BH09PSE1_BH09PSE1_05150 [soil metagenome]
MEDHQEWQDAYRASMRRIWLERALVTTLCLAIGVTGWGVWYNWSTRLERVFRPIPGLSYEPPPIENGVPITDISEALTYQKLSPKDAYAFNASVPVTTEPQVPSAAFKISTAAGTDGARALDCLTAAVYYEANSESLDGQRAVAQVVLNRVRHPAFPNSVCGVVFSGSTRKTGCQFTFTCDGALFRRPNATGWSRARVIAQAALSGQVFAPVGQATHYHTLWVAPYWSPSLVKVANIGAHTFYRWKGVTGAPGAFNSAYSGVEPVVNLTPSPDDALVEDPALDLPVEVAPPILPATPPLPVPVSPTPRPIVEAQPTPAPTAPLPPAPAPQTSPAPQNPAAPPVRRRPRVATPQY